MTAGLRAATGGVLVGVGGGGIAALVLPIARPAAFHGLLAGLLAAAFASSLLARRIAGPASLGWWARRLLAAAFQAESVLVAGVGLKAVDAWHRALPDARPGLAAVLVGLSAIGYLGFRLHAIAAALRPRGA
ncbi:MAG: hypothetical protein L0216_15305 [Planctomycetales bacterium]|nr:hypothetical protein [Planctomycetales bacterium]